MFANLKAKLLKVDLRKGGKKVFVFETNVRMSAGELEAINEMIDQEVLLGLDSQVISYSIRKNAKTDQPIINYKVNDSGVVEEVKPEGEQAEMDLGLPKEKTPVKEESAEIPRGIVEEFINASLAPRYEDMEYDFEAIINRHAEGDSYLRIASDLGLSSGKLAELLEEYFRRVAPLAAKWNEWREGQQQIVENVIAQATEQIAEQEDPADTADEETETDPDEAGDPQPAADVQGKDEVENFILSGKAPNYDDLPHDFKTLLTRKRSGETWLQVAGSLGMHSGELSRIWNEYKKRVKAYLNGEEHGAA